MSALVVRLFSLVVGAAFVGWLAGCQSPPTEDSEEPEVDGEEVLEAPGDPSVPAPTSVSAQFLEFRLGRSAAIAVTWAGGPSDTPTFTVERSTDKKKWSKLVTTYARSFTDTGASRSKKYYYRVKAHDSKKTSAASSVVSAQIPAAKGFRKAVLDVSLSAYQRARTTEKINVSFVAPSGTRVYVGFVGFDDRWIFQIATANQVICQADTTASGTTNFCEESLLQEVAGNSRASYERFSALLMAPFVRDSDTISGVRDLYDRTFGKNIEPRVRLACVGICERLWEGFNANWGYVTGYFCKILGTGCDKTFREILEIQTLTGCAQQCDECLDEWLAYCANPSYSGPNGRPEPPRYCFDYAEGCRNGQVVLKTGRILIN